MRARRKRGPPSDAVLIRKAIDAVAVAEQMEATTKTVWRAIQERAERGDEIPVALLGAGRMCAEWHTDYLSVLQAVQPPADRSSKAGDDAPPDEEAGEP